MRTTMREGEDAAVEAPDSNDATATLTPEPPTSSPRGPLSKFRKARKGTGDKNASTNSLLTAGTDEDDSNGGLRASFDGALDKLKERARKSNDERRGSADSSNGNRLSRALSKRKRRKASNVGLGASTEDASDSRRASTNALSLSAKSNQSDLSLSLAGSGRSSLLTEESENEGPPVRPTLSPHQSHLGYLTLSSPVIKVQTSQSAPESTENPISIDQTLSELNPTKSEQLSATTHPSPESEVSEQRQSPVDRFKGFSISKKKQGTSSTTDLPRSGSGGVGGLSGLFGTNSSKGSLKLQQETESTQSLPQEQEKQDSTAESSSTPIKIGARQQRIDTTLPSTPPNVGTPTTFVTPPTPTDTRHHFESPKKGKESPTTTQEKNNLSAFNSFARRGRQSNLPSSKLSNAISVPLLTPHIEETKTPGGSLTAPTGSSGFFSSVFTAAQNAANQLSNTINNSSVAPKTKQSESEAFPALEEEEVIPGPEDQSPAEELGEKKQLAVETLGTGDLSLSHLGISDDSDPSPMTSKLDVSDTASQGPGQMPAPDDAAQKAEENAAARAVSVAYEKPVVSMISQAQGGRPDSIVSADGDERSGVQTPPRAMSGVFGGSDIKRSGSVRSRISERTKRRHRGSSATTSGTLAAAISASTAALANPAAGAPGHRLTGFAVASGKRNKDFHQLFRSVPEDDYLIEDYSAALQRDILLHGRIYISEGHICFSSNILGWVTNLVISFDEIVSVEKKSTAVIFPNAIVIQTLHARNIFASLVARDSTYDLIIGIWKISHPNLKSSLNGVAIDDATKGDKTEKTDSVESDEEEDDASSDDVYDEDAEDASDMGSFTEAGGNGSIAGSDYADAASRKTSAVPQTVPTSSSAPPGLANADAVVTGAAVGADYPGQPTHAPTECGDDGSHYEKPLTDTTVPAPLGKVYNMLFGPASGAFMRKWLVEDQKSRELEYEDDKTGMDNDHKTFTYSYIKPLNAPVGPKQTKCIVTCTLEQFDLEKAVSVNCSTQTPDVPSGSIFTTKTRYCLMWGPGNSTRMIANCTIEWTGKSWLRGPIEKGANDGQTQYVKDLLAAVRAAVTTKPPVRGAPRGKAGKGKRRRGETFDTAGTEAERSADKDKAKPSEPNWGLLEPLRGGVPEMLWGLVSPVFTAQALVVVLGLLLAWTWVFPSGGGRHGGALVPLSRSERALAMEEIWRREESELWQWLEERAGIRDGFVPGAGAGERRVRAKEREMRLREDEGLSAGQVDDAIRVTEERLGVLKEAVRRRKEGGEK